MAFSHVHCNSVGKATAKSIATSGKKHGYPAPDLKQHASILDISDILHENFRKAIKIWALRLHIMKTNKRGVSLVTSDNSEL